jgi:single-stranded-DNA-specific exonuclease
MVNIVDREINIEVIEKLVNAGITPILARVLSGRGINQPKQLETSFVDLIPPDRLKNLPEMAALIADAIEQKKRLLVIGDYDCDGATATAVAVLGLRAMGADVDFLVPNRFEYGYGLTPEIVLLASERDPDLIITVDNGIASVEGVAKANSMGIKVLITDHHLPGDEIPNAACIVNPNQNGCDFPSKHLAGVGVIFYVMLGLRAELRSRGIFLKQSEPNLSSLIDIVALGTVADLVCLDNNNRIIVEQGLRRIRAGKGNPAINALLRLAGRDPLKVNAQDLGFSVGPRLNAAGRIDDMSLGIACLISNDYHEVEQMAKRLQTMNMERRAIEADMQEAANISLEDLDVTHQYSLSIFEPDWHQGIIGILASRLKDKYHRPAIVFAKGSDGVLKGSGRSIKGLHLRDALDIVSKRYPELILKFGGHAMAAGLAIFPEHFEMFKQSFEEVAASLLSPVDLDALIETDGILAAHEISWDLANMLDKQVWGQGFPPPLFRGDFVIIHQKVVGGRHLKLSLRTVEGTGHLVEAIYFNHEAFLPSRAHIVYALQANAFNGYQSIQLNIQEYLPLE